LELTNLTFIANSINKFRGISEVQIDLCELHGFNYQSGLIYTAYVPNLRKEIACGGRYTAYNDHSDKPRYATGFSLDIKDILNLSVGRRDTYV
jgi:ATP phosphoribosyltransferase regulatory subunit